MHESDEIESGHAITSGAASMMRGGTAVVGILLASWAHPAASAAPDANRFDGRWAVTLTCPKAPDGALPFIFEFTADVRDAMLHGENGVAGRPGWMTLDGRIASDGAAKLDAYGLTGRSQYNLNNTDSGVSYHRAVTAQFDAASGSGTWVTARICNFSFRRL
jgi:hypothetical protein